MPSTERDVAIQLQTRDMSDSMNLLHQLLKKKKELLVLINNKKREIEYGVARDISERREKESLKRIKISYEDEKKVQQLTSALMLELMQICKEEEVPRHVLAIAKILDNYQGGINTIRSNSTWISELISQLTDQMRNFDAGQRKLEAKFDLLMEKVR